MRKILLLIVCVVISLLCFAQSVNWLWARGPTGFAGEHLGEYTQEGFSVVPAPNGGAYVMGWVFDTLIIGNTVTTGRTNGQNTYYLARWDGAGNLLWIRAQQPPLPSNTFSETYGLASDASGNAIVTGQFDGDSMLVGNNVAAHNPSPIYASIFTVKYNSAGDVVWARSAGGPGDDEALAVATDAHNNIYVAGDFYSDTLVFGNVTLTKGPGGTNLFIVKYDSSGNVLWAKNAGESGNQYASGTALATDRVGNVYLAGKMACSSITFGALTLSNSNPLVNQMYLVKLDSAGNGLWGKISYGGYSYAIEALAVDSSNNVYATGFLLGSVRFGTLNMASSLNNNSMFLIKYNTAGSLLWNKTSINNPAFAMGLNDGSFGYGVATGTNNDVYVCGGFQVSVGLDTTTVREDSTYHDPWYAFDLDSAGNVLCATALSSGGDDQSGICADGHGNIFVFGDYQSHPFIIGGDTLNPDSNSEQFFLGKYNCGGGCVPGYARIISGSSQFCPGDTDYLCAPAGYPYYRWSTGDTVQCINPTDTGTYTVTITDFSGCTTVSNPRTIANFDSIEVSVTQSGDTFTCNNTGPYIWLRNGGPITGATSDVYIAQVPGSYTVQITDQHGCTWGSKPVVIAAGINDLPESSIAIYPNPSTGNWQLSVPTALAGSILEIFDVTGKMVYQSTIKNLQSVISIPGASNGIYQLRITSGDYSVVRKLIKL